MVLITVLFQRWQVELVPSSHERQPVEQAFSLQISKRVETKAITSAVRSISEESDCACTAGCCVTDCAIGSTSSANSGIGVESWSASETSGSIKARNAVSVASCKEGKAD